MAAQLLTVSLNAVNGRPLAALKQHLLNARLLPAAQFDFRPLQFDKEARGVYTLRCSAAGGEDAADVHGCSKLSTSENTGSKSQRGVLKLVVASFLTWFVSLGICSGIAYASDSIGASSLGLRIAAFLRRSGWPDEAVVFTLATLPVLELRGAIPVGYWMGLDPLKVYLLSVAGNMVPVPLVLLYLDKLSTFLTHTSPTAKKVLDSLYKNTRRKAGPIQEFKWLGLMLFVAVPFPGTGAWTGAIAAVVLGMTFWSSFWANFFGVVIAGIIVNLLVSLGLKSAVVVGAALFVASTFMWSFMKMFKKGKVAWDEQK